jgi:TonB family protein
MLKRRFLEPSHGIRAKKSKCLNVAALAAAVALTLPARAADERAIKTRVAPIYPELAKRMHTGGVVKFEASVDPDGKVTGVKTLSGNRALSQAAEDAVTKWRFVSAPAASTVQVDLNFTVAP